MENIKNSSTERILAAGGVILAIGGAIALRQINPASVSFLKCPFNQLTGLYCPGCGMTRGCHALLNGDILQALDFNALMPFFLFFGSYVSVSMLLVSLRGYGLKFKIFNTPVIIGFFIIAVSFTIIRNFSAAPFNLLAP